MARKRLALTNSRTLFKLHARAAVTQLLDEFVRQLEFIGGGDFWWSSGPRALSFNYKEYYNEVRESSTCASGEPSVLLNLDSSTVPSTFILYC